MSAQLSRPEHRVEVEVNVPVPMRDGTILMADVYRPAGSDRYPVLIERTPYGKSASSETRFGAGEFYASRGYVCIIQDVRGRFESQGDFYPFRDDGGGKRKDGFDTVEWAASQPWSNGKIGTIGGSYSGVTQYRMHASPPPHLVAQFVRQSSADYSREWVYRNGVFELGFNLAWATRHTQTHAKRWAPDGREEHYAEAMANAVARLKDTMDDLPLKGGGPLPELVTWWHDWLDHPESGAFWDQFNIIPTYGNVEVPVYHLGGWYDGFLKGTLENFRGMRAGARTEVARAGQRLTVGPWVHAPDAANQTTCGEVDFGPDAAIGFFETRLAWFDHWMKGVHTGLQDRPPVKLFVMGANEWKEFSDWPPPEARPTPVFLSGKRASACGSLNDGSLSDTKPGSSDPTSFVYDPADPIRTRGGSHLGAAADGVPNGQMDQRPIHGKVLTFTGPVLDRERRIAGEVTAVLHARSSAPDTDWVVKLVDVYPDGRAMLVCDGVMRSRYRNSRSQPEPLTGDIGRFEIDMWGTAYAFKPGHRMQVIVTSSDFPRWDRNMNTGGVNATESMGQAATNTVFHDADHPSHVVLPVI